MAGLSWRHCDTEPTYCGQLPRRHTHAGAVQRTADRWLMAAKGTRLLGDKLADERPLMGKSLGLARGLTTSCSATTLPTDVQVFSVRATMPIVTFKL